LKFKMTKSFWEKEYKNATHLILSTEPSSDMETFVKWALRNSEWPPFPEGGMVLDCGCGNGRNIIALCKEGNMKGYGFDISAEAIRAANAEKKGLPITFEVGELGKNIPLPDESVDVALDMMSSHFLGEKERGDFVKELARVVKPFGWLFFKTFSLDGDAHAKRLLRDFPSGEANTYIHPKIKVAEHVFDDSEIYELFTPYFKIHKMIKSYKHVKDGKPHKRRTVSVYMERKRDE